MVRKHCAPDGRRAAGGLGSRRSGKVLCSRSAQPRVLLSDASSAPLSFVIVYWRREKVDHLVVSAI